MHSLSDQKLIKFIEVNFKVQWIIQNHAKMFHLKIF